MNSPREMTVDEIRVVFIQSIIESLDYWDQYDQVSLSCRDRLEGLAFSFLVLLDGGLGVAWSVVPDPHPDDQEYCADQNENWFPISPKNPYDIVNGELHNLIEEMLNELRPDRF